MSSSDMIGKFNDGLIITRVWVLLDGFRIVKKSVILNSPFKFTLTWDFKESAAEHKQPINTIIIL